EFGCTDSGASNYSSTADVDNGTCTFPGCTNASACNYDAAATSDDGSCVLASGCDSCSGETDGTGTVVDGDSDDDGVCDGSDLCSNTSACNYDGSLYANAACDVPGSCDTCSGGAVVDGDSDDDGICDGTDLCSNTSACNYDGSAYANAACDIPGSCDTCSGGAVVDGDSDDDGVCDGSDLCSNTSACNYDGSLYTNAACDVPGSCDTCSGGAVVDGDSDDDGICDGTDLCSNTSACNYDGSVYANAACDIPGSCDTCSGGAVVDGDSDDDGVCDASDLCSNTSACNYDGAVYANAACDIPGSCDTCSGGAVVDGDVDSDGVCDTSDNCTDLSACNYDGSSSNVSCLYNDALNVCGGDCVADNNSNGICDTEECIDSANPVAATNDTTLYLDASGNATVTAAGINDGSTDDCLIASYALDIAAFDCTDIGASVTVTLTVTDGVGNTDTETATVTVLDNTAPAVSASDATVSLDGSAYTLVSTAISASATDNCTASPTLELSKDDANWSSTLSYTCLSAGANTVYVRATDGSGNVSVSTSVTLTIQDTTDPTISNVSSGLTEILSGAGTATVDAASYVTASDNCTSSGSLTYEISETDGSGYATTFASDCGDIGAKTFYFRVTDAAGNASSTSGVITIADQTSPTISSVSGATVDLDANGDATITASDTYVTSSDACTASASLTYLMSRSADGTYASSLAVDCADLGSLNVYFKTQDAAGNTSAASSAAVFTVRDVTGPTASASDATVSLDGSGAYTLLPLVLAASSTDNCESSMTYQLSKDNSAWSSSLAYSCADVGSNTVYVRASDGTNEGASVSITLTIQDDDAPTVSASNATVSLDGAGSVSVTGSDISVSASDNCAASPVVTLSHDNSTWASALTFNCDSIGGRTVYYRASDGTNTSSSGSVTVTVQDATGPTFSTPGGSYAISGGSVQVFFYEPTGSSLADNCVANGSITKQVSKTGTDWGTATSSVTYDCTEVGGQTVYLKATDSYGNATTSSASITITSAAPTISSVLSGQTEYLGSDGTVTIDASAYVTATDDCSSAGNMTYEISETAGSGFATTFTADCADLGSKTFYFRVTDESNATGLESSQSIVIADQTAPALSATATTVYLDANGAATLSPASFVTASDNCTASGSLTLEMAEDAGGTLASSIAVDCSNLGTTTYKFVATDAQGNASSEVTADITVADNIAPTATANAMTINLISSSVTLNASNVSLNTSTDNDTCSALISTVSVDGSIPASSYDFTTIGTYTVTLAVTDAAGNTSSDNATVTVTTAPTVLWSEDFENDAAGGMCGTGTVAASDNNFTVSCGSASDYAGPTAYAGSNQFAFDDAEGVALLSPVISITGYIVDVQIDLSENGALEGGGADIIKLETSIDGAGYVTQQTRTDETDNANFALAGIQGSSLQIRVVATNDNNEIYYIDNLVVQGCEDADGDGICDPVDACVDFPAGSCGCTDQTACNYDTQASKDDGSCNLPGMMCAAPSGGNGYVYSPNETGDGCNCVAEAMTQLYIEPFDDEINVNESNQATSVCSTGGYVANGNNWTLNCGSGTGVFTFPSSQSGTDLSLNVYQASDAVLTTASVDVSAYAYSAVSAVVEPNYSSPNLEATDGWTLSVNKDGTNSGALIEVFDDVFTETTISTDVNVASVSALQVVVEGDAADAGEDIYLDDIQVQVYGKKGCTDDADVVNYDPAATYDDGSCELPTAYSYYNGGFTDKIWRGDACAGGSFGCGTAPFVEAVAVAAAAQTASPSFSYNISAGTTVTADGTQYNAETSTYDLYVKDLFVEDGGLVHVPTGFKLVVKGTFTAMDSDPFSGDGLVCLAGPVTIPEGEGAPDSVGVGNIDFPPTASLNLPNGKSVIVSGNVSFGAVPPVQMTGKLKLKSANAQTVSGQGAKFDVLEIQNSGTGVTFSDGLEVTGRLILTDGDIDVVGDTLKFGSDANGSGLLDAIPSGSSIKGTFAGGRMANQANTEARVQVGRFIGPDSDGTTNWGYTMYGTSISGATVSDFNGTADFYSAGWPGSDYPSSTSTISFWNESTGSIEYANSSSTSLTDRGCWVLLYGTQSPTMKTEGTLNDHKLGGSSKTFSVTRQGPVSASAGWNMVYNPYQARLDWDAVIDGNSNSAVIEDQFLIFDTQDRRFRRYGKTNSDVQWSNDTEAGEDSIAMQYVNPGQGFWVRVKDGVSSGTVTLDPSMIDNDGSAVGFIRNAEEGILEVLLEVENENGATRMVLRFGADGSAEEYRDGDMSYLGSSTQLGESAVVIGDQKYVAKRLPLEAFDGELFVRSRANMASAIRVVEVLGVPGICAHIEDHVTGEVMVLEEGAELAFTLPAHQAEEGRFTLHSVPFGSVEGRSPDCPNSEEGTIVMELGDAVADVTVTNYETMEVAAALYQETGTVEVPMAPGEYAVMVDAYEGTSLCRGGRRQVVIAPGEQPELLGVDEWPSDCNAGMASLEFELYGSGDYQTELMQGNTSVWSETLPAGEHTLEGIVPGEYVLKVTHPCLVTYELVSLLDDQVAEVNVLYNGFVQAESNGGAWLEAVCPMCETGDGYGYTWFLDGEEVGSDEALAVRVDQRGTYSLELVTYGFGCPASESFDITVGKYLVDAATGIDWLGLHGGMLGVRLAEEWRGAEVKGYDAAGRLVLSESLGDILGENFIAMPDVPGWLTVEIRSFDGKIAHWVGVQ
ncbi:hypothetical protein N9084_00390, partial [Flavobacteriales bacterium]|nr:hypothetical protein [Flavobacteriales bacterium]